MRNYFLIPILFCVAQSWAATVTLDFSPDTQGFADTGDAGGALSHSTSVGAGSLRLTNPSGWIWRAFLNVGGNSTGTLGDFDKALRQAGLYGGKLRFNLILTDTAATGISDGFSGVSFLVGFNQDSADGGGWDQLVATNLPATSFPMASMTTIPVVIPLVPSINTAVDINDAVLSLRSDSSWYQIQFGTSAYNITSVEWYVDNLSVEPNPAPSSGESITLDFSSDTEGFADTSDAGGALSHSTSVGAGSLRLTNPSGWIWRAFLNVGGNSTGTLGDFDKALRQAGLYGGKLRFNLILADNSVTGISDGFSGVSFLVGFNQDSADGNGWDQLVATNLPATLFPMASTTTVPVVITLVPSINTAVDINDAVLSLRSDSSWYQIQFGTSAYNITSVEWYIDNLSVEPNTAPSSGESIALEAENGILTGNTHVTTAASGYSGTGYVTGFQSEADTVSWTFTGKSGIYELVIRFRSPYGEKGFAGSMNDHGFTGMFPSNSVFGNFDAGFVEVIPGPNTLQIGGSWNWYEIDRVDLNPLVLPSPPAAVPDTLVDPLATLAARTLMANLVADYGKHTWSGQYDTNDVAFIQNLTGRRPAIVGADFMDYSPSRVAFGAVPAFPTEAAIALAFNSNIVTVSWHWNAPDDLINTPGKEWWRGFYTDSTTFDLATVLADPNSLRYSKILRDIDAIAVQLKKFSDANIPVLWRPLHEAEGGWFWWGAKGPEPFKQLWRLLYTRLTGYYNLHNLIWVLTSSDPAWYPGNDVVDIVGYDGYPSDPSDTLSGNWQAIKARFDGVKLIALTEFGGVPDIERMQTPFGVWWSYFVSWGGTVNSPNVPAATITRIYQSPSVITVDELPPMPPPVINDTNPPSVVAVRAMTGSIEVEFSEAITTASASNLGNYTLSSSGAVITGAVLQPDYRTVRLSVTGLAAGGNYTLTVRNITDLSGNLLLTHSYPCQLFAFNIALIGNPHTPGIVIPVSTNSVNIRDASYMMWGGYDETTFVYQERVGDFDMKVRVDYQDDSSKWARAGLMAREALNVGVSEGTELFSAYIEVHATPNDYVNYHGTAFVYSHDQGDPNRGFESVGRLQTGGETRWLEGLEGVAAYPNCWIRMRRVDNHFTTFWSVDSTDWHTIWSGEWTNCPASLYVGPHYSANYVNIGFPDDPAVYSHLWLAQFRDLADIPPLSVAIVQQPTNLTVVANSQAAFSVLATGDPIKYQWRHNGTNVPGATNAILAISVAQLDAVGAYSVLVYNWGSSTLSSNADLTVTGDTTKPILVQASGIQNHITVSFSEPVEEKTANNIANYIIQSRQVVSANRQANLTNVVLTLNSPLASATAYTLTVNNVADLSGNVIASGSSVSFNTPQFIAGSIVHESYADFAGNNLDALVADPRFQAHQASEITLLNLLEIPADAGDVYGTRLYGVLLPPESGNYTFYLASDDQAQFWLSTDETPAHFIGGRPIVEETSWAPSRRYQQQSAPIALDAGRLYYFEAWHREGYGGDNLAVAWSKPSDFGWMPPEGSAPISGEFLGCLINPANNQFAIVQQPTNSAVQVRQAVSFAVTATARWDSLPFLTYQWQRNNTNLPGATNSTYVIASTQTTDHNATFRCVVSLPGTNLTSSNALLTVLADTEKPRIIAAGAIQGTVSLLFSEELDAATATTLGNYSITGAGLSFNAAILSTDRKLVTLAASGLASGNCFTLSVRNVKDYSDNLITTTNLALCVMAFGVANVGNPIQPGTATLVGTNGVDLANAGRTMWNAYDETTFVYQMRTGDFDVMVRIEYQDDSSQWARAGLMAREILNAGTAQGSELFSPYIEAHVTPWDYVNFDGSSFVYSHNQGEPCRHFESNRREVAGGMTSSSAAAVPAAYPNCWIRLRRINNLLTTFCSTNGIDWTPITEWEWQNCPATLFVGPHYSVDSVNIGDVTLTTLNQRVWTARFRDLSEVPVPISPPQITSAPMDQTAYAGENVTFHVSVEGSRPFAFQWQFNETNMPGATNQTLLVSNVTARSEGIYSVQISNGLGTVHSTFACLTVMTLEAIAGPIVNSANGHAYYLLDRSTWPAAEATAVRMGGHLATLRNQAEQNWVYGTFRMFDKISRHLWIGLYDPNPTQNAIDPLLRQNEFVWTSGEPVTYQNWDADEPNNYQNLGGCFVHISASNGGWNDTTPAPSEIDSIPIHGVVEVANYAENALVWSPGQGPIIISDSFKVSLGQTLTIQAGSIVKFLGSGSGLDIEGTLDIQGTSDQPVVLTSFYDDTVGGDTDGRGNDVLPQPGNWIGLHLFARTATVKLDHAVLRYADFGLRTVNDESVIRIYNSEITDCNTGVELIGYTSLNDAVIENALIARNQKGGVFHGSSYTIIRNATFADNAQYAVEVGDCSLILDNCILAFNGIGLQHVGPEPNLAIRGCCFTNATEINWWGQGTQPQIVGTNGNLRADPHFINHAAGDYGLASGSPAIDAANGSVAPATDLLGRSRYDDLGMPNVGFGSPSYVDMGAFERQDNTSSADLAMEIVSSPSPAVVKAGDTVTLSWSVVNTGLVDVSGVWRDVVYLSSDEYPSAIDLVTACHTNNRVLHPGEQYSITASFVAPTNHNGLWYLLAQANATGSVVEPVTKNNIKTAGVLAIDVPILDLNTPSTGVITQGQWTYLRLEGNPGRSIILNLEVPTSSTAGLFVRYGSPPTLDNYDLAADEPGSRQQLRILSPQQGTYYIGVYGSQVASGSTSFNLTAQPATLNIRNVTPDHVSNVGQVTIKIEGDDFDANAQIQLLDSKGRMIEGTESFQDAATLYATFDLTAAHAEAGTYHLLVNNPNSEVVRKDNALIVENGGVLDFQANLSMPGTTRPGRTINVQVDYWNAGTVDLRSPILTLAANASDCQWQLPGEETWIQGADCRFLGLSSQGPATVLRPGQKESLIIRLKTPLRIDPITIQLTSMGAVPTDGSSSPIDWIQVEHEIRPSEVDPDTWLTAFNRLKTQIGLTWGDYANALRNDADRWFAIGRRVYSVRQLFEMELDKANRLPIGMISGKAVDSESGIPLSHVIIEARDASQLSVALTYTSDDGTFVLSSLDSGSYSLSIQGYSIESGRLVSLLSDITGLEVRASKLGELVGVVVGPDQEIIWGAQVQLSGFSGKTLLTQSDLNGQYCVKDIPLGDWMLSVSADGYAAPDATPIRIDDPKQFSFFITMLRGASIAGHVTDDFGMPIVGAQVSALMSDGSGRSVITDATGSYRIDGLVSGECRLRVEAPGLATIYHHLGSVGASEKIDNVDFSLAKGVKVLGYITDQSTDAPITNAIIWFEYETEPCAVCKSNQNGSFSADQLSPGACFVNVLAEGYDPYSASLNIPADNVVSPIFIRLLAVAQSVEQKEPVNSINTNTIQSHSIYHSHLRRTAIMPLQMQDLAPLSVENFYRAAAALAMGLIEGYYPGMHLINYLGFIGPDRAHLRGDNAEYIAKDLYYGPFSAVSMDLVKSLVVGRPPSNFGSLLDEAKSKIRTKLDQRARDICAGKPVPLGGRLSNTLSFRLDDKSPRSIWEAIMIRRQLFCPYFWAFGGMYFSGPHDYWLENISIKRNGDSVIVSGDIQLLFVDTYTFNDQDPDKQLARLEKLGWTTQFKTYINVAIPFFSHKIACPKEEDPSGSGQLLSSQSITSTSSSTPEDKFGPGGYDSSGTLAGSEKRFIPANQELSYRVEFWNKSDAVVATQDAIIEDILDPNVYDLNTFVFTRFGFLKWDIWLNDAKAIDTLVDLQPEMDLLVNVTGTLNPQTGKIRWEFHCLDPLTGEPPEDIYTGFLPPFNPKTRYELGWVEFTVKPKGDLPTGTQIKNQAFVEFDYVGDLLQHPAPKTGPWINTVDGGKPSSSVIALPAVARQRAFTIQWQGHDDAGGSGIGAYDLYVSDNSGPWTLWLNDTTNTAAIFTGQSGHTYGFYSVARDNVSNREDAPMTADATTIVPPLPQLNVVIDSLPSGITAGSNFNITVVVTNDGKAAATGVVVTNMLPAGINLISASVSQGSRTNQGNLYYFRLGTLATNTGAMITLVLNAAVEGLYTNLISAGCDQEVSASVLPVVFTVLHRPNTAPIIPAIADRVANEGQPMAFTITAIDTDTPAQTLTFNLAPGAPAGASLTANGRFSWTPTEAQGPSTNWITITVADSGSPSLSATNTFKVVISEVNTPPLLLPIASQSIRDGSRLALTNTATDTDFPTNRLTFRLLDAPTGATLNASSGVLTWIPTSAQAGTNYTISVEVADNGQPVMTDTKSFSITVLPATAVLRIDSASITREGNIQLRWQAQDNAIYQVQFRTNLIEGQWIDLPSTVVVTNSIATAVDPLPHSAYGYYRLKQTGP